MSRLGSSRIGRLVTYVVANLPLAVWLLRDVVERTLRGPEEAAELDGDHAHHTVLITLMVAPLVILAGLLQRLVARAFVAT
jgi:ABC-type maltose transport system permease subunit